MYDSGIYPIQKKKYETWINHYGVMAIYKNSVNNTIVELKILISSRAMMGAILEQGANYNKFSVKRSAILE